MTAPKRRKTARERDRELIAKAGPFDLRGRQLYIYGFGDIAKEARRGR